MLSRIIKTCMFGLIACGATYTDIVWWNEFGVKEAYPYILAFICAVLWGITYSSYKEKED